jgi:membrane protease YdiL (CAAX protease family)
VKNDAAGLSFAVVFPLAAAWLYFVTFADSPFMITVYGVCKTVQFAFPLAWLAVVGPRRRLAVAPSPGAHSIPGRNSVIKNALVGLASGLALAGLMWGVYGALIQGSDLALEAAPRIAARIHAIGATTPMQFLAMTLLISLVHSLLEEYYWRWFIFGRLRASWGDATAGLASSLAFAGHHAIILYAFIGLGRFWWVTAALSLAVAAGGGIWAALYARTGSLLAPWLSHVVVDLGIFAIGYHLSWGLP